MSRARSSIRVAGFPLVCILAACGIIDPEPRSDASIEVVRGAESLEIAIVNHGAEEILLDGSPCTSVLDRRSVRNGSRYGCSIPARSSKLLQR